MLLPLRLEKSDYVGEVWGYFHPETKIYNILAWDEDTRKRYAYLHLQPIGMIYGEGGSANKIREQMNQLLGFRTESGLQFVVGDTLYKKEYYDLIQDVFSRNTGILETNWLMEKKVCIIGGGSVGSLVAVELARAGVGQFVLIDNDIMAYHNVCRHQCSIPDVGKYKAKALKERILAINPMAKVFTYIDILENSEKEAFDDHCTAGTVIVSCADNREADVYASRIANMYNVPFVSIGFWERAFAGEIFYFIPEEGMPCYECAIGTGTFASEARPSMSRRFYTTQRNIENMNFEPGIAIDIDFVTLVGVKLILDIMNRNNPKFTPRVINYLTQFTLVCNTNDVRVGGDLAEIFAHPLQITSSIKVNFRDSCPPCKYRR